MCQPMPRNCNCPPPVQIDARADEDCSCDCPSAPECACPPSERRFSRTKVKCPNARICCPVPRQPPGTPCCCIECRPCLPPPCDPCSSTRCRPSTPRTKPCRPASPCPPSSPCRPKRSSPCQKPAPPSPSRSSARSSSRGSSCCSPCRAPGQSSSTCDDNGEVVEVTRARGDDGERYCAGDADRRSRCRCAHDGKGCVDDCRWRCSRNCAGEPLTGSCERPEEPGNNEGRAPNVLQVATGVDKSLSIDHRQVDHSVTKIEAAPKLRAATYPGNAAAVGAPGARGTRGTSGWKVFPRKVSRSAVSPVGGTGNSLSNVIAARKSAATPGVNRTPIGTNALHARLVAKRMAPGRSGLGVQTHPASRDSSKG
ncbi:uncharacterized protein [Neodiprion pinetum]|uniref:uncharacterized protein n=1 Tax=Neodiprion pinetum TaxID=441929 RepID=UPI001EDDFE12|nr:uncharacterized protein LOC124220971 [Neodiprion pinetum]